VIGVIILAAGWSRRMGQPKMLLPWGGSTVIRSVIETIHAAGLEDILVVTGANREGVEAEVGGSAQTVFNRAHEEGEMLSSIQTGLAALKEDVQAALIALGDQPQIRTDTVTALLAARRETRAGLIVPSYNNRRGHPWLVERGFWTEILAMRSPASMRDFFRLHTDSIQYVQAPDPSVLADLDTPEDYKNYRP